ncbi:hypothetical protein [Streptomyces sp. NBC_00557]|uniref:hypothetical protein n=1 Tax=Streptomyces sp. NBC_00557 TaxID=2975776 RepID=UPI002E820609|nr:hypothetical protein [Streptomyces sp. NBC_00557]WUC39568.1 hypothetical protein OG956_37985 [Streptomyces sp. NBC_00557]
MPSRKNLLEALRALRDHEEAAQHGWVLLGMLRPDHHKACERPPLPRMRTPRRGQLAGQGAAGGLGQRGAAPGVLQTACGVS